MTCVSLIQPDYFQLKMWLTFMTDLYRASNANIYVKMPQSKKKKKSK